MKTRARKAADPTRAIALVRASTDRQEISPAAQMRAISAFAKAAGITVVRVFEERGISGGADIEDRTTLLESVDWLWRLLRFGWVNSMVPSQSTSPPYLSSTGGVGVIHLVVTASGS